MAAVKVPVDVMIGHVNDAMKQGAACAYWEIMARINAMGLPYQVDIQRVSRAIMILRRNQEYYGWTIPHCRHGKAQTDRLFRLPLATPAASAPLTVSRVGAIDAGGRSNAKEEEAKMRNSAKFWHEQGLRAKTRADRNFYFGFERDCSYMADKAAEVAQRLMP